MNDEDFFYYKIHGIDTLDEMKELFRGVLMVFIDGPDRIGKTTLIDKLYRRLINDGFKVLLYKEPMTDIPEIVNTNIHSVGWIEEQTKALGYDLDRMIIQYKIIEDVKRIQSRPLIVLVDRSFLSTIKYQTPHCLSYVYYLYPEEDILMPTFPIHRAIFKEHSMFIIFGIPREPWVIWADNLARNGYYAVFYGLNEPDEYASDRLDHLYELIRQKVGSSNEDPDT